MNSAYTIDVALACPGWTEACPSAETLARGAADLAVARGTTALRLAWKGAVELGIILTDAADQQQLNHKYRGVDQPTNVLAFPLWEPGTLPPTGAPVLLGDVVLALETTMQEALQQNKLLADHLRHLTVHGVLHLLGYGHQVEAEAVIMESLERSILAELGVPDPYRDTMSLTEPAAIQ